MLYSDTPASDDESERGESAVVSTDTAKLTWPAGASRSEPSAAPVRRPRFPRRNGLTVPTSQHTDIRGYHRRISWEIRGENRPLDVLSLARTDGTWSDTRPPKTCSVVDTNVSGAVISVIGSMAYGLGLGSYTETEKNRSLSLL